MLIDCDTCTMRDIACSECVVSFLAPAGVRSVAGSAGDLTDVENRAIAVLAASGLVPPLRMTRPVGRTG